MEKPKCYHEDTCDVDFSKLRCGMAWRAGPNKISFFGTDCILYKTCSKSRKHWEELKNKKKNEKENTFAIFN